MPARVRIDLWIEDRMVVKSVVLTDRPGTDRTVV